MAKIKERLNETMSTWHVSTIEAWQQGKHDGNDDDDFKPATLEAGREIMVRMMIDNIFDGVNLDHDYVCDHNGKKIYLEVDNKTEYNDWLIEVYNVLLKGTKWVR